MPRQQATLCEEVEFHGTGVHTGLPSNMLVLPAPTGSGIVFIRKDIGSADNSIKLSAESVKDPLMCTRIVNESGTSLSVIEHFLAALKIRGITNAIVEVNSSELPILDGSSKVFVKEFDRVGIKLQNTHQTYVIIKSEVRVQKDASWISITPSDSLILDVALDYPNILQVIHDNNRIIINTMTDDLTKLYCARTFGWYSDQEKLLKMGLAKGASLENTVVLDDNNAVMNPEGLRCENEPVWHKALDLLGDCLVVGYDIVGKITAYNPSHLLNNMLMNKLMSELSNHTVV
jgi:UDP-3-O-[3-hydroxymyristoyl] N-acetylglucosamine deacetylase